jgi:hypothetical protein
MPSFSGVEHVGRTRHVDRLEVGQVLAGAAEQRGGVDGLRRSPWPRSTSSAPAMSLLHELDADGGERRGFVRAAD